MAVYDNPTGDTIPGGGMGEIAGIMWPRSEWPESAAHSPRFTSAVIVQSRVGLAPEDPLPQPTLRLNAIPAPEGIRGGAERAAATGT